MVCEFLIDFLQWMFVHQAASFDRWSTWGKRENYGILAAQNLSLRSSQTERVVVIDHGSTYLGLLYSKKKMMCSIIFQIISELYETKSDHKTAFLPDWNPRAREAWLWSDDRLQKASGKKDAMGRHKKSLVFGTHDTLKDMKGSRGSE